MRRSYEIKKIFISYNHEDEWFAVHARDALKARLGSQLEIFLDQECLQAGQKWRHELDKNARESAIVLLIIGPYWSQPEFIEELKAGKKPFFSGKSKLRLMKPSCFQLFLITQNYTR